MHARVETVRRLRIAWPGLISLSLSAGKYDHEWSRN